VGLVLAGLLAHLVWRAVGGRPTERRVPFPSLTLMLAGALLAVYAGQELLEGELALGHARGLTGVLGSGGWIAVPLSLLFGAALACFMRQSDALAAEPWLRGIWHISQTPLASCNGVRRAVASIVRSPLARHMAGRAPPTVSR